MSSGGDAWLFFRKELVHLTRDKRAQVLTLVLPVIAMGVFAFTSGGAAFLPDGDADPVPMAVVDHDRSAESQRFIDILQRTGLFHLHVVAPDRDVDAYMRESGVFATLVIPDGFSADFSAGQPRVDYVYDNTKPYVGALTLQRVKLVLDAIALEQGQGVVFQFDKLVTTGTPLDVFTPGIIVLLITFTSLNDVAVSLTRERSDGTLGRVFLAPTSLASFLAGKTLAGLVLVLFRSLALLALAVLVFGVAFHGSLVTFLVVCLLTGLVTLGLGLAIAARANTDREVLVASLLVVIVLMFLMGTITPVDLMMPLAQDVAAFVPHAHATDAVRGVMLLGAGLPDLVVPLSVLAGASILLFTTAGLLFRRSLA